MRIAVVGSGIAGLAAAWLLARHHRVTLFEAEDRLGGHANTLHVSLDGLTYPVDTGFLVFNRRTYPHLSALFATLGVATAESEMSFSVSLRGEDLEWAGTSLATVFAQRSNLARPAFWGMLQDVLRFNREAGDLAAAGADGDLALGAWLERQRYGRAFRDWYLLPMAAAIWSCPTRQMLEFPVATFARFCANHGLLQIAGRPQWLTVAGGAREYVRRMAADLDDIRIATPVRALHRGAQSVWVRSDGAQERFDLAVLATHSDQALRILGEGASAQERAVLGAIGYQRNRAVLHTDEDLLPRARSVWSAWNYMGGAGAPGERPVSVSYLINRLQPLPFSQPVVVSLNPFVEPRASRVLARLEYAHPVFDGPAIAAQRRLAALQGVDSTYFCGAWTGYGFHEDGLRSAIAVANALGVSAPWQDRHAALAA